ncbi:MAG: hypothetical protein ACRDNS_07065 [Trebonia sp.]
MMRVVRTVGAMAVCAVLVSLVVAAGPASAQQATGPAVFYDVTYAGTAQLTANGENSCASGDRCFSGPWHGSFSFTWSATYHAVELSAAGGSASTPTVGQQLSTTSDQTDTECNLGTNGCSAEHCAGGTTSPDPSAPALILTAAPTGGR